MARFAPAKVAVNQLAALAFAAARINNGKVYKSDSFWNEETKSFVSVTPNKILMRDATIDVTDQDRALAAEAIDLLTKDRVVRILKNAKVPDFQNTLTNLVTQEQATMSDAGLMAFLPSMVDQIQHRQKQEEEMAATAAVSQYLGAEGDKVTFTLSVINSRWVERFACWAVTGTDSQGNLISFFTNNNKCTVNGNYTAKIKRTEESKYHSGAKVTTVNFVKQA